MNLTDYNQIKDLLTRHGFRFSKSMGQNFLTASWVPEKIAESARLDASTAVLEIGPGIGCLTVELSRRAGKVLSVELDRSLMPVLSETLAGCDNTEILFADVLKIDLPAIVQQEFAPLRPVVCANLPYNITSPVLTKLVTSGLFDTITVMIQREVARRICAGPGESDYSAFGILMQWYTEPEILFDVSPGCFIPQPKVTSSVIRLTRRAVPPVTVQDEEQMFSLVRAAFNQRRKTLVNALASGLPRLSKEEAGAAVLSCGFDPRIRGEALSLADFARLSDNVKKIHPC
ncbi:MAG: 16S rRNA (adenine(1518)-N(6)/adenine(1519)-N(6))-dimethyltransferase RsmA [Oscillospiraceae bacterium]|nr:16S rRNA (adenine(1518)-N(6)/adenine(1519)-N(6))-dimethyltransferase RsmA [Oscillospiraceae bacterium]